MYERAIITKVKLEAVVVASALDPQCRLKAVLQLLAVVCPGDTDICRKSMAVALMLYRII